MIRKTALRKNLQYTEDGNTKDGYTKDSNTKDNDTKDIYRIHKIRELWTMFRAFNYII